MREVIVAEGEETEHKLQIEYLNEAKFNVYDEKGNRILTNADIILNPER